MTTPTYTPRTGSLASQVISFFRNNPDEELLLDDITDKFDATRGNIHTLLAEAVRSELLARYRNDDGDYVYKPGAACATACPPKATNATRKPATQRPGPSAAPAPTPAACGGCCEPHPHLHRSRRPQAAPPGGDHRARLRRPRPAHPLTHPQHRQRRRSGGIFAGLTTRKDGSHCAVVLLPDQGTDLTWKNACNWAQKLEAELPSRPVAALLFANVKDQLRPAWHWTSESYDASYAWYCDFSSGGHQGNGLKSFEGSAVAVRLIPLEGA